MLQKVLVRAVNFVDNDTGLPRNVTPFRIPPHGHGRGRVSRRRLCRLNVLGLVVNIRQDRCTEPDGGNILLETCVPLDSLAHSPDFLIRKRHVFPENERFGVPGCQISRRDFGQSNEPVRWLPSWSL